MAQPFIERFKDWLKEDLGDPSFSKRKTDTTTFSRLRVAHTTMFERLLKISGEQSKISFAEFPIILRNGQQFYNWPGNFRKFRFLELRDATDPTIVRSRIYTRNWNDPTTGLQIMSQSRGFKVSPVPVIDEDTNMVLVYQRRPGELHYANADSYTNSGVPKIMAVEEITAASYSAAETAAEGVTAGVTDNLTATGGVSPLSTTRALKIHFTADKSNVQVGDKIRVYLSDVSGTGNVFLMAGTADTTVTISDRITASISDSANWVEFVITAALMSQVVTFGNSEWQLRVAIDPATSITARVREVEITFSKEKLRSSLVLPATVASSQGSLVLVDGYYNGDGFLITSADTGAEQVNWCDNFNAKTRVARMRYDWDPPLSGTVQYEILPCIDNPYDRLIGYAASMTIAGSRRDYPGRRDIAIEYQQLLSAAIQYYTSNTDDRAGSMIDTKPGQADPYRVMNIY